VTEDPEEGLRTAATVGVAAALSLARRWAADPLKTPRVRGLALPVLGRFGGPDDRPLAAAFFDDPTLLGSLQVVGPGGPTEYRATTGDLALAVSVRLAGGDPSEFGFGPRDHPPGSGLAWVSLGQFGFADEDARRAASEKAKTWLRSR
jgi:hypothetical protein